MTLYVMLGLFFVIVVGLIRLFPQHNTEDAFYQRHLERIRNSKEKK